jgi:RHS repeat-associated protein
MNDHTDWADARLVKNVEDAANTLDGMYYLRARYYNPANSRMLSEDPIRDGLNWYTYCGNNPLRFFDPTGLEPKELRQLVYEVYGANANADLLWNSKDKTASIYGYNFGSIYGNGYINASGKMIVDDSYFMNKVVRNVSPPGLDYHPTRDSIIEGAVIGTAISAPGLVRAAGSVLAPVADKAKQFWADVYYKVENTYYKIGDVFSKDNSKIIGKPFEPYGIRIQNNVDPRTLIPGRDISEFTQASINDAWRYASEVRINVDALGRVLNGNHRLVYALQHNLPVNIQIGN